MNAKQADRVIELAKARECAAGWMPYTDDGGDETFIVTVVETDTGRIVRLQDFDEAQAWAGSTCHE
jgi:hypothetical protein